MIYLDNSATTLEKPPQVGEAMAKALCQLGNPGRSFHRPAMDALRTVLSARREIGTLTQCKSPLSVAFTSGSTESLNLVISSLIAPTDHVITTALEHNSVLRPLYLSGCQLSILPCDALGNLVMSQLEALVQSNTKYLVVTHGSNLLGTVTPVSALKTFAKAHGLTMILDVSQTLGCIPVTADMADILCFTGHKALMGPQGTGGIIVDGHVDFSLVKTGGAGSHSFDRHQSLAFPDIFEAGTPNSHGLAGLCAATKLVNQKGVEAIMAHEGTLCQKLLTGLNAISGVKLYGNPQFTLGKRLPVIALNLGDIPAEEIAMALWERWEIATRPGSHCAPLVHEHYGTQAQGMVRLSLGYYNTESQMDTVLSALETLAKEV